MTPALNRRALLGGMTTAAAAASWGCATRPLTPGAGTGRTLPAFYEDIERRTFNWFWETTNRSNGLVPDRWPTPSFSSIAAIGFGLTAYGIGVHRGWVTREAARDLTLTTLRTLWTLPQGPAATGVAGHSGFFYHFLHMDSGLRYKQTELSSVDTSLLLMGVLFAGAFFDRDDPAEAQIRKLADDLYARADWSVFSSDGRRGISMGWHPETGLIERNWDGYNEGMLVHVLALGSPRFPAPDDSWANWIRPIPNFWRGAGPTRRIAFAPLFGHQYSHIWIDFRGIRDAVTREAGFDYFENSRRATYGNRAYCAANPMGWRDYSKDLWGLTACDGPGGFTLEVDGRQRKFYGYAARGPVGEPDGLDDGTIAPTAALGSLPFAPEIVIPCAEALRRRPGLYRHYGFADSFNPTLTHVPQPLDTGSVHPSNGWIATDYLGIDQGPILLQAANYRDDFVWSVMRRVPAIRRGLQRAGFSGGWLG
ncbi:Tat pathway signal protein [Sphingomonas sabuli]|uniref:Tat pathway signal protein n=1 Tax=Sphingomonas sabuli TaxID=2764186 RepID=A0A7G9KZT9_9SPHN|nr:glucoamylase family protein [Sphingomonas sabuli]QNM81888.1 Tat pathway signal protein [Sphingomonas sabuli]